MKRIILTAIAFVALGGFVSAQSEVETIDPARIGVDTAQQKLKEVSVEKFETAGLWEAFISADEGVVTARLFEGVPEALKNEPVADPRYSGDSPESIDKYVLGVKTEFFRRGFSEIFIKAKRPIPIEGISKTISVWVVGRSYNHELSVLVEDFFGSIFELSMGKLNFQGWKKLTVAVPPQQPDGVTGIIQRNYHYTSHMGIKVLGFKIACAPEEAYGTYYVYLDELRSVTDLFAEDSRDPDDMADTW